MDAFLWQQQLRFYWMPSTLDTEIRICDFRTKYFYEWIGNTGRLVITPLTDRCYVTLTMGLRLFLGGAPAGPAGTGKTETTKDLARALALPCYVFNCSDQMNYQTMADIFRGLAQTGTVRVLIVPLSIYAKMLTVFVLMFLVGLFRRIQPNFDRSVVCRGHSSQNCAGLHQEVGHCSQQRAAVPASPARSTSCNSWKLHVRGRSGNIMYHPSIVN